MTRGLVLDPSPENSASTRSWAGLWLLAWGLVGCVRDPYDTRLPEVLVHVSPTATEPAALPSLPAERVRLRGAVLRGGWQPALCARGRVESLAVDPQGRVVAVAAGGAIEVLDVATGHGLARHELPASVPQAPPLLMVGDALWFPGHRWDYREGPPQVLEWASWWGPTTGVLRATSDGRHVVYGATAWDADTGGLAAARAAASGTGGPDTPLWIGVDPTLGRAVIAELSQIGYQPSIDDGHLLEPDRTRLQLDRLSVLELDTERASPIALDTGSLSWWTEDLSPSWPYPEAIVDGDHVALALGNTAYRARIADGRVDCSVTTDGEISRVGLLGSLLMVTASSTTVVWDCATSSRLTTLPGPPVQLDPGQTIAALDSQSVWSFDTSTRTQEQRRYEGTLTAMASAGDAIALGRDACIAVSTTGQLPRFEDTGLGSGIDGVALAPNGSTIAAVGAGTHVFVADGGSQRRLVCPVALPRGAKVAYTDGGRWLVAYGGGDGCAWRTADPSSAVVLSAYWIESVTDDGYVIAVAHGRKLVSPGSRGVVELDLAERRTSRRRARAHAFSPGDPTRFHVSGDRRHVLTWSDDDEEFFLRSSATGAVLARYRSSARHAYAVPAPSLQSVVIVEHDGTSTYHGRVWHPFEDRLGEPFVLPHPEGWLRLSDDGQHLAVTVEAGLQVLALPEGTPIAAVEPIDDRVTAIAFGPGSTLAVGTARGGILRLVLDATSR